MTNSLVIPYFQTTRYRVEAMVALANPQPGEKAADLGSGDGRILIAFAKAGIEMHGFEIDPTLVTLSEKLLRQENLQQKAFVHMKNFWQENLSAYDIITIYGMPDVMEALEEKLQRELKSGARVVSNYYPFPHWKETTKKNNVWLYKKD